MGITLRIVTGSTLTYGQVDTNFSSLYYSASQSGNNLVLHTTGSFVQAATTTTFNLGLGYNTIATGIYSHAEGDTTRALGNYSHAEGYLTLATGSQSHAEGINTTASGYYSHAEGQNSLASGDSSHAEGYATTASEVYSHAEGYNTHAAYWGSHAEGVGTRTTNYYAHAEGLSTLASGNSSHAEGHSVTASGDYSHAEGFITKAIGPFSHAEGTNTVVSGTGSHAEGFYTTALGDFQHVQGQYNISSPFQSAFILGNGTSDGSRSNLIYASGSEVQISGSLTVGSGSSTVAPTYGFTPNLAIGLPTGSTGAVLDLSNTRGIIVGGDTLGILQFSGLASGTSYASSQIRATVSQSPGSGNAGGGILSFWTGQANNGAFPEERIRINNIGNVGIGTTDPPARLTLGVNDFMMVSTDFGGKAGILFSEAGAKTSTDVQYGAKIFYDEANDLLQLSTRQNNVDKLGIVITRADGNVGIGKTDPQSKLDVNGSTIITGSLTVTSGITGSFKGDGSQITGVTAEWDGSHNGNATITGSLTVSNNAIIREGIFTGVNPPGGTSGGYFNIGNSNGPYYSSFAFLGRDDSDSDGFGTVSISANPEDGISIYGSTYDNINISNIIVKRGFISMVTPLLGITTAATSISASNSVKLISPSVQITGSLITSGTILVGGTIIPGTPTFGSTPDVVVGKSTGGVLDLRNTNSSISPGDILGTIQFSGGASTTYASSQIKATVYTNPGSGNSGGGILSFWTGLANTGASPEERMRINQSGNVGIGTTADTGDKLKVQGNTSISGIAKVTGSLIVTDKLSNGVGTVAVGSYSHAEGGSTKAGTNKAYLATSFNEGIIELSSIYGNVTSSFPSGDLFFYNDNNYDDDLGEINEFISDSQYSGGVTTIELAGDWTSYYGNNGIVGNLSKPIRTWNGNMNYRGEYSHAEGYSSISYGVGSHAEGYATEAQGDYSHAEGYYTQAIGPFSHAEGQNTKTAGDYQHVQGKYNITSSTPAAFILGNGTSDISRSNLIFAAGNTVQITGSLITSGTLLVGGTIVPGTPNFGFTPNAVIGESTGGVLDIRNTSASIVPNSTLGIIQFTGKGDAVSGRTSAAIETLAAGYSSTGTNYGGILRFMTAVNGTYTSPVERMRINNDGKVGIGTTDPEARIHSVTSVSGPVSYGVRAAVYGENTSTDTNYANSIGVAGKVSTTGGMAIYGDATTGGGWAGYFNGKLNVNGNTIITGSLSNGIHTSASGNHSHAEGTGSIASGEYSHAEGYLTNAAFYGSHAEGAITKATAYYAHAEGLGTLASGNSSHAEGHSVTASGDYSHAEGYVTRATGPWSHTEGTNTVASETGSHAEGYYTVASGLYQHVQGQFNISSPVQSAFIHGNGTSDGSRSNLIFAAGNTVEITGSLMLNDILVLAPRTTTPTPSAGMVIVSGSGVDQHIYCYLNSTWKQLD